jgi:hypothetical protein
LKKGSSALLILLANSKINMIRVRQEPETFSCQRAGPSKNEFASSPHDRRSPPRMNMWYNLGCAAGPEVAFDTGAVSLSSRRTRMPAGTANCRL